MSAYIINNYTTNILIGYLVSYNHQLNKEAAKLAQTLIDENHAGVATRYGDLQSVPHVTTFSAAWVLAAQRFEPVEIIRLCDNYDMNSYQSEAYYQSDAAGLIRNIRRMAIGRLPGYDAARSEVTEEHPVIADLLQRHPTLRSQT